MFREHFLEATKLYFPVKDGSYFESVNEIFKYDHPNECC